MVGGRAVSTRLRLLAMSHVCNKIWATTIVFIARSGLGNSEIHFPDLIVCALGGCEKDMKPLEEREAMYM